MNPTVPITPDRIDRDAIMARFWRANPVLLTFNHPAPSLPGLVPLADAAARMGTTVGALYTRRHRGTLRFELVKAGGRVYAREADVIAHEMRRAA